MPVVDVDEGHGGYWHHPPELEDDAHHVMPPVHAVEELGDTVLPGELEQESEGPIHVFVTEHQD